MLIFPSFFNAGAPTHEIEQSLRFDGSSYLSWTPGSAGNRKTWTWSGWVKRSRLDSSTANYEIFGTDRVGDGQGDTFKFRADQCNWISHGSGVADIQSSALFRDASAWYHIVIAHDTTQATASNRVKIWVNGEQITAFGTATYMSQNYDGDINNSQAQYIAYGHNSSPFNGYMAEVHLVDGTALNHEDFGESDDNGVWRPKRYTGSYGTNGFYLKFDPTATNGIGHDHSGNGNNFTPTGFDTTNSTASTYDVMSDTPTDNFATVSPLNINVQNVLSDGNLTLNLNSSVAYKPTSTIAIPSSGKFYFEGTIQGGASQTAPDRAHYFGLNESFPSTFLAKLIGWFSQGTRNIYTGSGSSSGASGSGFSNGDVLQCAVDADTGKVWMGLNNTWYSTAANANGDPAGGTNESATMVAGTQYHSFTSLGLDSGVTGGYYINFGQRPFAYTPPTGFKTLSTKNLPAPTVKDGSDYFNTVTYTGDGTASRSLTGVGFAPSFVWIKNRDVARHHSLHDVVRGTNKYLMSSSPGGELTDAGLGLASFDSDGFTLGTSTTSGGGQNGSGEGYVAWNWLAGGTGSSNTTGSITSTVSANPTAGFSIVSYVANGTSTQGSTVGHGLGVAPKFIIAKDRDASQNWFAYSEVYPGAAGGYNFNTTQAAFTSDAGYWNSTAPTSTVFTIGNYHGYSGEHDMIAYCFAEVEGYSKFGSYVGNGNPDGPFVFCGFKPRWIMLKKTNTSTIYTSWSIYDTARDSYNVSDAPLYANVADQEGTNSQGTVESGHNVDILSNGFKLRDSNQIRNTSGDTYIFAAFAEHPTGGSGVSPATAR